MARTFWTDEALQYIAEIYKSTSERALKSLNVLCVRLVFCLYADDAGIFGRKAMFHDYLAEFEARHMRKALIELFDVLDALPENRDPYLDKRNATRATSNRRCPIQSYTSFY